MRGVTERCASCRGIKWEVKGKLATQEAVFLRKKRVPPVVAILLCFAERSMNFVLSGSKRAKERRTPLDAVTRRWGATSQPLKRKEKTALSLGTITCMYRIYVRSYALYTNTITPCARDLNILRMVMEKGRESAECFPSI